MRAAFVRHQGNSSLNFIERVPICPVILLTGPLYTLLCLLNVYVKILKISFCFLRFPEGFLPKAGAKIETFFLIPKLFGKVFLFFFFPVFIKRGTCGPFHHLYGETFFLERATKVVHFVVNFQMFLLFF